MTHHRAIRPLQDHSPPAAHTRAHACGIETADVLVLGGGVSGLAAAGELGRRAVCLERDDRPGGLVRTERWQDFWFDRVIHLLHISDPKMEGQLNTLLDGSLAPCPPVAWIECSAGTARYPIQMNLGHLEREAAIRCARDFATAACSAHRSPPADFEAFLLESFGGAMVDFFFGPYNRKLWKRPLDQLAPAGHTWNIARPDLERVLRGLVEPSATIDAYNKNGWYPRPPAGAPLRGMELLATALAARVRDLRLGHRVEHVDLDRRTVSVRVRGTLQRLRYRTGCVSTIPLPRLLAMCEPLPGDLRRDCRLLVSNRVRTVAFAIRGPRPTGRGMWRYYTDESVVFNRLIYMHEFDPLAAPPDGWGVMAEVTERGESRPPDAAALAARARADLHRVGALPPDCRIVQTQVFLIDPAYVVFTPTNRQVMSRAREFLGQRDVALLGRYGNWEYSSMEGVIRNGMALGERLGSQ